MQLSRATRRIAAVSLTALAALLVGVAGADAKTPKIHVLDDYFTPAQVTIKQGGKVKFVWGENANPHNATLRQGPKNVKKRDFTSRTGAVKIKFSPTFKKKGTYKFVCSVHPVVMQATVKVKAAKKKKKKGKRKR